MALKINTPVFIDNYERYGIELEAWHEITNLQKVKQGIVVALLLSSESSSDIHDEVFEQSTITNLKGWIWDSISVFRSWSISYLYPITYLQIMTNSMTSRNFIHEYINWSKIDQLYNHIANAKWTFHPWH